MAKRKKRAKKGNWLRKLMKKRGKKVKPQKKEVAKKIGKKRAVSRKSKEEKFEVGFEEVTIRCASCGKEFRIVKSSQFSTEGMLCQRCAAGGGVGFEEEGDI